MTSVPLESSEMNIGGDSLEDNIGHNYREFDEFFQKIVGKLDTLSLGDPELGACLKILLGISVHKHYVPGAPEDLETALKFGHAAISGMIEGDLNLSSTHQSLGGLYNNRYFWQGDADNLESAIKHYQLAVNITSPKDSCLSEIYQGLGGAYYDMFELTEDPKNLDSAIKYFQAAVNSTHVGSIYLPDIYHDLGESHASRYERIGNLDDLEASVKCFLSAKDLAPQEHPKIPSIYHNLGSAYLARFRRVDELNDLELAIEYMLTSVNATPEDDPYLPGLYITLGASYNDRFKRVRQLDDLKLTAKYYQIAVNATPEGHSDFPGIQHSVSRLYHDKYGITGNMEELESAFDHLLIALNATPEGHYTLPGIHQTLGAYHLDKYRRVELMTDLESAMRYFLLALKATPEGHPSLPYIHQTLGVIYENQYQKIGHMEDQNISFKYHMEAFHATPLGHPNLPGMHLYLGLSYNSRYTEAGNLNDLETAIKFFLAGIDAASERHPDRPGLCQNLGLAYNDRYRKTGDVYDLEAAIKCLLTILYATPEGSPSQPGIYHSLGRSYCDRYNRIGDSEDLEEAIECLLLAINGTPQKYPTLPELYHSLGTLYHLRYQRIGELKDLEAAIEYFLQAKDVIHAKYLPKLHQKLGAAYNDKYKKADDLEDLEAAIEYFLLAINSTPEGNFILPSMHHNLGSAYGDKYRKMGNVKDLEAGISYCLRAVDVDPETHNISWWQSTLAYLYELRYHTSKVSADLDASYKLYMTALKSQTAPPQVLWKISVQASHTESFTIHQILESYRVAINVLPSLLWLGSSLSDRHDTLISKNVAHIVSKAVSVALQASDVQLAATFMEQGLSTTHKQILQLRNDHILLQAKFPNLFQQLQDVSAQLQDSPHKEDVNYHILAHKRQQLISRIHEQSGFEDFLLPPTYSMLCAAAEHGPVIMVNCSEMQTDIIIILSTSAPPVHLSLLDMKTSVVAAHVEKLRNALNSFDNCSKEIQHNTPVELESRATEQLDSVISWLWTAIVKPVFDILNKNGINNGRLWWCPSGLFTYLPLHAAAPLDSPFIQSYTPTLETLIHANKKHSSQRVPDIMTAVGVVETSAGMGSWSILPSVEDELNAVTTIFGGQATGLKDSQATRKSVMEAMPSSSWLHFACHGEQNPDDPLTSGLMLYDGKLELSQILDLKLSNAKFVYLSACETAMGDPRLMNEAMHLIGGFLVAGFQGAIGTLWGMMDRIGPRVAEIVYKTILSENKAPDVRMAAYGLHIAIQKLRQDGVPLRKWMPFIHFGV